MHSTANAPVRPMRSGFVTRISSSCPRPRSWWPTSSLDSCLRRGIYRCLSTPIFDQLLQAQHVVVLALETSSVRPHSGSCSVCFFDNILLSTDHGGSIMKHLLMTLSIVIAISSATPANAGIRGISRWFGESFWTRDTREERVSTMWLSPPSCGTTGAGNASCTSTRNAPQVAAGVVSAIRVNPPTLYLVGSPGAVVCQRA